MKFFLATAFILCGALHLSVAPPTTPIDDSIPDIWKQAIAVGQAVLRKYYNQGVTSRSEVLKALNIKGGNGITLANLTSILSGGYKHAMESKDVSPKTKEAITAMKNAIEKFLMNSLENTQTDPSKAALGANLAKLAIGVAKNGRDLRGMIKNRNQDKIKNPTVAAR